MTRHLLWGSMLLCACGASESEAVAPAPGTGGAGGAGGSASTTTSSGVTTTHATSSGAGGGEPALGAPYPIVLAHGFFGFDDFAGAGFVHYFHGVRDHLEANGEPLVFTPTVDPFNDSTTRGEQLLEDVEAILAETGHAKVNLIGHSQGGLDARVVASLRPDLVASVVTLQTPHDGTPVADIALELVDDPALAGVLDFLVQLAGQPLWDDVGEQTSLARSLQALSTPGAAEFNETYPDQPGIFYASIAGRSDYHGGGADCEAASPPYIADWEDTRDPLDPFFNVTEPLLDGGLFDPYPNDGLVRARDAKHGLFLGCLPADHLDQIGQLLGDGPGFGNQWDHLAFYLELVHDLRARGL